MQSFWGLGWLRTMYMEETESEPIPEAPQGSWPVFEVLGSSVHLNWTVPLCYLGPSLGPELW